MTDKPISLYFAGVGDRTETWRATFKEVVPSITVVDRSSPKAECTAAQYAFAWKPKPGDFDDLPQLRAIFGLGAGVDGILADASLPTNIPLIRMVEEGLTQGMVDYCLWRVLYHHRRFWETDGAQQRRQWLDQYYPAPWDRVVGIMGLGEIGQAVAERLAGFKFKMRGWSRTPKTIAGVDCYAGSASLPDFLSGCDILVCLLPLTAETRGILNADLFQHLPMESALINAGRGGQLNEADLLLAMREGRIGSATLDVFQKEPLPADHPFWSQERLFVTPHNASFTDPKAAVATIWRQIQNDQAGKGLDHIVDRQRGY